jgi:hypothetical protein
MNKSCVLTLLRICRASLLVQLPGAAAATHAPLWARAIEAEAFQAAQETGAHYLETIAQRVATRISTDNHTPHTYLPATGVQHTGKGPTGQPRPPQSRTTD